MGRTDFENLRVYRLAEDLADQIWDIISRWEWLAKSTVGIQLVKAADSLGANIAEGCGRGTYAENRRFAKIARGSLFEVKHWLRRAYKRQLLTDRETALLKAVIDELTPKLGAYIKSIGSNRADD